ncbi:MAG: hypothetical protein PW792_01690 [Acidobacteriaceae bacterium]|nr:hypothetical protein [Acidobacteriaceae bacterium]
MRPLRSIYLFILSLTIAVGPTTSTLYAQMPQKKADTATAILSNNDVISLVSSGLSDDVIIAKIQKASATSFDTSIAGLRGLKAAGVSNAVIKMMIDPNAPLAPSPTPGMATALVPPDPDDPHSPHTGIYIQVKGDDGKLHMTKLLTTMMSDMKGPGFGSMLATTYSFGMHKSKSKTVVAGAKSQTETVDPNPVFYDYTGDMSINNLSLVHFEVKGGSRMVTNMSMGSIFTGLMTKGPGADEKQAFTAELIRPGVYRLSFTKPLEPGAYAFGDMMSGQMMGFHDFDILPPQ